MEAEREGFLAGVAPAEAAKSACLNRPLFSEKDAGQPATGSPHQNVHTGEGAPVPAPPIAADEAGSAVAADALKSAEEGLHLQPSSTAEPGPLNTKQQYESVSAQLPPITTARPVKFSPREKQQRALRENGALAGVFRAFQQLAAAAASAASKRAAAAGGSSSNLQEDAPPPAQQQLWGKQRHDKQRQQGSDGLSSAAKKQEEAPVRNRRSQQHLQKQQPQRLQSHPYRIAPRIRDWLLQGVRMRHSAEATVASDERFSKASPRAQVEPGLSGERLKETGHGTSLQPACEAPLPHRHLPQSHVQPAEVQHPPSRHQQEPAAACSWGVAAAWLVHRCFTFGSTITAAAGDTHSTSAASSAGDEGPTKHCHCVRARPQVLLRELLTTLEPQQEAEHQQPQLKQLSPRGAQLVTVSLGQRHLLLCCTQGFPIQEGSQLLQAGRVLASVSDSSDTADAAGAATSVVAAAASDAVSAAAAVASPRTASMGCRFLSPLQEFRRGAVQESSLAAEAPDAANRHVSTATHAAAAAAIARSAEDTEPVAADANSSASAQQQSAAKITHSTAATAPTASFSLQLQRQEEQHQQEEPQDSDGETLDKPSGGAQERQQLLQQQHQQLSSHWGGHLVFWTWRRSCMRQHQARPSHATVTAAAAAAAAAACYRQQTTKSLALQLLLLLLPHDVAVRLITERDPAQCQQQPSLQLQQQQEQRRSESVAVELPENHAPQLAADDATCGVPALELGRSSVRDTGSCAAAYRSGEIFEPVVQHAHELPQIADEHDDEKPRDGKHSSFSDDEQLGKQQHRHGGKQQPEEKQQPAVDAGRNVFDLKPEEGAQQQHQQPQQADEVRPEAASAVGGFPGAPQLYGREFVRGTKLTGSFLRLHFDFASLDAGARIVAASPGMQHVKAVQRPDGDTYMLVPCSVPTKYFVLSFAETLKIEFVAFQSLEIYANAFWHIQLLGADTYPSRQWRLVANIQTAADVSSELFSVKPECSDLGSCWARFLKVRLLTHHDEGSHYYCSLTSFQVLETHLQDELGGESPGLGADADEGAAAADALAAAATAAVAVRVGGDRGNTTRESDSAPRTSEVSAGEGQPPLRLRVKTNEDEAYTQQAEQHQNREHLDASKAHLQQAQQQRHTPSLITTSTAQQKAGSLGGNGAGAAFADSRRSSRNRTASERVKHKADGAAAAVGDTCRFGQRAEPTFKEAAGVADSKLPEAAQQQQQQLLLLLKERPTFADAQQQTAAAVHALSAALEEAVQQQHSLLPQRRQQLNEQQLAALRSRAAAGDALWVEIPESVMTPLDVHGANTRQDKTSCMSSSSNATTRWQRYQPLLQPTTRRYICTPADAAPPIHVGFAPNANAYQVTGHLVAVDARGTADTSTKSLPAEAASEALQQASAYARAFLLEVLKHQRPQQHEQQERQRPIGSAFLDFLMKASPDAPQQQAEILRVLSLLLQPLAVETTSAAAAAEEEEMLQQPGRGCPEAGDAFCRSVDDGNSNVGNNTEQQHHHCRPPLSLPAWSGLWDSLQQMLQPLHLLWSGTMWLTRHVGGDAVALAGLLGHRLHQLICEDPELALLQQSCAAASGVTRVVSFAAGLIASAATAIAGSTYTGFSFATAAAAAMWSRLFALTFYPSPHLYSAVELPATTGSQSSTNPSWGQRLLLAQDRRSAQSAESFAASMLLVLLLLLLLLGAVVLWRLRRGQRVAAAAAGECALLRRSFERLQQQHRQLQQQLLQFEREQELLLLLTANHQSSRSSRLLLHRTKSNGLVADGNLQQHQQQRQDVLPLENKEAPEEGLADAAHPSRKPTSGLPPDDARGGQHATEAESALAKAAAPAPSLLRRLSSTLAPRMLFGLSRQANANPVNSAALSSNSSVNSGASRASSTSHPRSAPRSADKDRGAQLRLRRPPLRREDSEGQQLLLLQEQQQAGQPHLQLTAAALLPALDTKALRGLKLQRHTVRQRRVGGAATPVASPAAAAADGHCPALSPAGVRTAAALPCDSRLVGATSRDATVAAAKAAPSRTSSSRSSSVYSASGHNENIYKAFLKGRISSTPLPSVSLLLESAQQRAGMRAGTNHRTSRNAVDRSYSSSGSCSSSSGSFVQPAPRAATAAVPLRWYRDEYHSVPNTSRAAAGGIAAASGLYIDCSSSSAADGSNVSEIASHRSRSSNSSRSGRGVIQEAASSRPMLCGAFEGQRLGSGGDCRRSCSARSAAAGPPLRSSSGPHAAADLGTRSESWVAAGLRDQRSPEQESTLSIIDHAEPGNVQAASGSAAAKATPMSQQEVLQQHVVQARRDGRRRRKKRGAS
ncbi:hypothetical protein ACSSS7_005699 [Eimeria intestinalis]